MGFLRAFLGGLSLCLVAVALVVGTVNPLGGFWGHWFPTTIPITRSRKESLFERWQAEAPVQGLVLGSSRSMKLEPKRLTDATGRRFFNFAVSVGGIADAKAILSFVADRGAPVQTVILGIDPPMLAPEAAPQELQSDWELGPRVNDRRPDLLWRIGHGAELFKESLSLSFVKEMATSVKAAVNHKEPLHEFDADGYLEYRTRDRAIAAGTYDRARMIRRCISEYGDSLRVNHTFDRARVAMLRETLARARARGIKVTMWLTPYHPAYYAAMATEPGLTAWLASVPDTLRAIATATGTPFVDLSTIDRFGGDTEDWYDCVHVGVANASRITDRLLQAAAPGGR